MFKLSGGTQVLRKVHQHTNMERDLGIKCLTERGIGRMRRPRG